MTVNDHLTMDLSDIRGIRFECRQCGAAISFRTREVFAIPHDCPGCRTSWLFPNTPDVQKLETFTRLLKMLAAEQAQGGPFRLCLEIEGAGDNK